MKFEHISSNLNCIQNKHFNGSWCACPGWLS